MTSTQVTPAVDPSFASAEGFVVTHLLVVADRDRSREFYRALFGADVLSERDPLILKVASWLILNAGGGQPRTSPLSATNWPRPGQRTCATKPGVMRVPAPHAEPAVRQPA
jgi:hypothetical protein